MNEHLLDVSINDKKAHLQNIQIEVRIASEKLSEIYADIDSAKKEFESVSEKLSTARGEIQSIRTMKDEADKSLSQANELLRQAESKVKQTDSAVKAAQAVAEIVIEAAKNHALEIEHKTEKAENHISELVEEQNRIAAEINSLEYRWNSLKDEQAVASREYEETILANRDEIDRQNHEITSLKAVVEYERDLLDKVQEQNATYLDNIVKREKEVAKKEKDIEVYRERLRRLVNNEIKNGRHLGTK